MGFSGLVGECTTCCNWDLVLVLGNGQCSYHVPNLNTRGNKYPLAKSTYLRHSNGFKWLKYWNERRQEQIPRDERNHYKGLFSTSRESGKGYSFQSLEYGTRCHDCWKEALSIFTTILFPFGYFFIKNTSWAYSSLQFPCPSPSTLLAYPVSNPVSSVVV
jgi:hypothetical protein